MKGRSSMRTLALSLAALTAVGAPSPTPIAAGNAVATASPSTERQAAAPATPTTTMQVRQIIGGAEMITTRGYHPVWIAREKRGSRRNRSRWNFNR